jgi:hypothetical protein
MGESVSRGTHVRGCCPTPPAQFSAARLLTRRRKAQYINMVVLVRESVSRGTNARTRLTSGLLSAGDAAGVLRPVSELARV